jgi:hypothetical protein
METLILFKFKEYPETRPGFPCEAFRWSIQSSWIKPIGFELSFAHQHKYKGEPEWHTGHARNHGFGVFGPMRFGSSHFWYDGPHCSFSLGWLHLIWSGKPWSGRCQKCEGTA